MIEKALQVGRAVLLAVAPSATDQDVQGGPRGSPGLLLAVYCFYRNFELAAATCQGGRDSATASLNY